MQKTKLTILIGGKTGEHRVNLISSKYVLPAINRNKYDVSLVGIDRKGTWYLLDEKNYLIRSNDPKTIEFRTDTPHIFPVNKNDSVCFIRVETGEVLACTEVFFSLIGGTYAEDGRLQGLLDMLDVAYVGPGVTGSALGMDKVIMKEVLRAAGLLVADFIGVKKTDQKDCYVKKAKDMLGFPLFVKPANLGSSVGVTKAYDHKQLLEAIELAFTYDNKIIFEKYIKGREIECAVLGNHTLFISVPGEIIPKHDFYSYEAKYIDPHGAELIIPARLNTSQTQQAQELSKQVYETLDCACFGRVDFFLTEDNKWYTNEINTIPGFTNISMYPKLMEASGISYPDLIDRLIQLAFEKKRETDSLKIEIS